MKSHVFVSSFAAFKHVKLNTGEVRYYPATANRQMIIDLDAANDPYNVFGYGVYDTNTSVDYAIELFSDEKDAVAFMENRMATEPVPFLAIPENLSPDDLIEGSNDQEPESDVTE